MHKHPDPSKNWYSIPIAGYINPGESRLIEVGIGLLRRLENYSKQTKIWELDVMYMALIKLKGWADNILS